MDDLAVRSTREQTIYAVRSNMTRDDACQMIVPSDLRLLIGAIDQRSNRIEALEAAALAAKVLLESEDPDVSGAVDTLHDALHSR